MATSATDRSKRERKPGRSGLWRRLGAWLGGAVWALAPLAVGLYVASGLLTTNVTGRLRNIVFDQYQRWSPRPWSPDLPVRVVLIDDESIARHGQWPWPHDKTAELINRLTKAGAAVIGFDIVFAEKDRLARPAILQRLPALPEREALRKAMDQRGMLENNALATAIRNAPVVMGYVLARGGSADKAPVKWGLAKAGDDPLRFLPWYPRAILPLPDLTKAATGLGSFNMAGDQDLLVRRVPLFFHLGAKDSGMVVPSLSAEALRVAQRAGTYIIKSSNASGESGFGEHTGVVAARIGAFEIATGGDGTVRVHFSGSQPRRHIPAWKVFDGTVDPGEIRGRIILVGSGASALADFRSTPLEQSVSGVDAHAELIEQVLSGVRLIRPDFATGLEFIVLCLGALLLVVLIATTRALTAGLFTLFLLVCICAGSWLAFRHMGYLIDPLVPGVTWIATAAVGMVGAYRRTEREKQFVRQAFSRYLSPDVVEQIARDPEQLSLGGETRDVTILFSDARDFTPRSETLDAAGVVRFLNALHTPFTGAVLRHKGTIDKYIGDGLMAFWNAPLRVEGHANRACAAALEMLAEVPAIDAVLARDATARGASHMPLRIGIGINTGEVFVGNMGSDQRFDYSIVGDPVNVAARLESATKEFAVPILVSEPVRDAATDFLFVELGAAGLKGKTSDTSIFALHGPRSLKDNAFDVFLDLHHAVIEAAATSAHALNPALAAARAHPLSAPYHLFYDRLERLN
ncbi:MAG: adenylate/guanylate cyclase domain-containing protein [Hyphomicrobiales bacterium]|nr:adenylate/guanylate cyclase domain-containing protein [Hyphomicrobiales bacterium]